MLRCLNATAAPLSVSSDDRTKFDVGVFQQLLSVSHAGTIFVVLFLYYRTRHVHTGIYIVGKTKNFASQGFCLT